MNIGMRRVSFGLKVHADERDEPGMASVYGLRNASMAAAPKD